MLEPEKWVDDFGDELYRFALSRIKEIVVAEDVVQETFLSAWKSKASYNGTSSERNWLFAICTNKIIDQYRKTQKSITLTGSAPRHLLNIFH